MYSQINGIVHLDSSLQFNNPVKKSEILSFFCQYLGFHLVYVDTADCHARLKMWLICLVAHIDSGTGPRHISIAADGDMTDKSQTCQTAPAH